MFKKTSESANVCVSISKKIERRSWVKKKTANKFFGHTVETH